MKAREFWTAIAVIAASTVLLSVILFGSFLFIQHLSETDSTKQVLSALKQTPEIEKVRLDYETAEHLDPLGNNVKEGYQILTVPQEDGSEKTFRVPVQVFKDEIAPVMEKRGYMLKTPRLVWPKR